MRKRTVSSTKVAASCKRPRKQRYNFLFREPRSWLTSIDISLHASAAGSKDNIAQQACVEQKRGASSRVPCLRLVETNKAGNRSIAPRFKSAWEGETLQARPLPSNKILDFHLKMNYYLTYLTDESETYHGGLRCFQIIQEILMILRHDFFRVKKNT